MHRKTGKTVRGSVGLREDRGVEMELREIQELKQAGFD